MGRVKLDFDEDEDIVEAAPPNTVAVEQLQPNPENPRPSKLEIKDRANDLRSRGQLQNINIMSLESFSAAKPHLTDELGPQPYVVVNGCLRLASALEAGVPRLKYEQHDEWDENGIDEALVNENEDRTPLNPLLLGRHLQRMLPRYGSARKLAAALNKQQAWISQRLRLTELDPELQQAIEHDRVMFKVARECSRLHPDLQPLLARGELSEAVVRQWLVELRLSREEQLRLWREGPPYLPGATGHADTAEEGEYPVLSSTEDVDREPKKTTELPAEYPVLTTKESEEARASSPRPARPRDRKSVV